MRKVEALMSADNLSTRMGRASAALRLAVAALGAIALMALPALASAAAPGFDRHKVNLSDFHLFDLGTTDYDGDLDLDLFTTNHLERQSLLANDGSGHLTERLFDAGLAQTRPFPGWEGQEGPERTGPGLYFSQHGQLYLRLRGPRHVHGSVEFMFPTGVTTRGHAHAQVTRERGRTPDRWVAHFAMHGDSALRLDPEHMAHPFVIRIRRPFKLREVVVGSQELHPQQRRFTLYLRDRHGIAWGDFNRDGETDAYVVRGGLRGRIGRLAGTIEDELLLGKNGRFHPTPGTRGLEKSDCRGRAAAAVDFNGDGRLDLFQTCKNQPPRLYRRRPDGSFEDASNVLAGAGADPWVARWLDLSGDEGPELLGVYDRRFAVFARRNGRWRRTQSLAGRQNHAQGTQLTAGDIDNDGDQDLYAAAATGSTLLENVNGRLVRRNPGALGLPRHALAAAWTDFDDDGDLDLHAVPGGLFAQDATGSFARSHTLPPMGFAAEAHLAWPDLDNDGARDAVISTRRASSVRRFKTVSYANESAPGNHWLELELTGRPGNPQAIGARVEVTPLASERQTGWVGQNETSLYSQGHYRLYFGLGAAVAADVTVRWPDGSTDDLGPITADQVLEVAE